MKKIDIYKLTIQNIKIIMEKERLENIIKWMN